MEAESATLKIKIFMWLLYRKVIQTKVNLSKGNWQSSNTCCFCDKDKTIRHLFIDCPLRQIICHIVYIAFHITPPTNITNLFENWLHGVAKKEKAQIRVGACTLLRAI